jgi:hypothetical protein
LAVIVEPEPRAPPFARARGVSVAKHDGEPNEDAWQCSRKGVAVVSDGASVSFDSATWSHLLVRRYAQDPRFGPEWLEGCIAAYAGRYDRENLNWMQQAAFDRGSFASLLAVRDKGCGRVDVLAVGDSLAVLCDGDRVVATFPYEEPEQFEADPLLVSTIPSRNVFFKDAESTAGLSCEWDLGPLTAPSLLCVTDALGRWILTFRDEQPSPIARLRQTRSRRAFARLVAGEREAGRMRRDDTTMLACWEW